MSTDWAATFREVFAAPSGSVEKQVGRAVFGDDFPEELDTHSYVTWTELRDMAADLRIGRPAARCGVRARRPRTVGGRADGCEPGRRRHRDDVDWRRRVQDYGDGLLARADELAAQSGGDPDETRAELAEMQATIAAMTRRVYVVAERAA